MSKPEKHGDALERESREDYPEVKDRSSKGSAKDEFDDLESSEELLGDRAGMGKEIKIGLAVIAVLLLVLGRGGRPAHHAVLGETASGGPEAAKEADREHRPPRAASVFSPASKADKSPVLAPATRVLRRR